METIKITVSLDDAGSLLHRFQDLVFSLLNTTVTYTVPEHRKLFLSGPFHFPFSHSLYIIYLYCALKNYNQFSYFYCDSVLSLLSPLLFCYMLLCHWVIGVWYLKIVMCSFHQGLQSPQGMTWILCPSKIRPLRCLKTSGTHHSVTDFHIPEEQKLQMHQCNSVKITLCVSFTFLQMTLSDPYFSCKYSSLLFSLAILLSPHLSIFLLVCLLIPNMQLLHFTFNFICPFY